MENEHFYMMCEICNIAVNIDDFTVHTRICEENERLRQLSHLVYHNSQIPSGNNLRTFVRDHFHIDHDRDRIRGDSPPFTPMSNMRIIKDRSTCYGKFDDVQGFECPICIEEVKEGDLRILKKCKHKFCSFCIEKWFSNRSTCPICRKEY
jgi:hypothetical protein